MEISNEDNKLNSFQPIILSWYFLLFKQNKMGDKPSKLRYFDGSEYFGTLNEKGQESGKGVIMYANGDKL